jgi:hypothetical protein
MGDHTRRKDEDGGKLMETPSGPKAPAEATTPSDPPAAPPGRSAGGHGAEVQVPLGSPERETGTPGREAPSPEIAPHRERLAEGSDAPKLVDDPSDHPAPRGSPDGEP